jgi:hypothetical protein
LHGNEGQGRQKFDVSSIDLPGGPLRGGFGGWIEIAGIDEAYRGVIVVSRNRHQIELPNSIDTGPGVWAVPNGVAQAPDDIKPAPVSGVGQDGLQSLQVCVDVG